jgi:hypothetical protein
MVAMLPSDMGRGHIVIVARLTTFEMAGRLILTEGYARIGENAVGWTLWCIGVQRKLDSNDAVNRTCPVPKKRGFDEQNLNTQLSQRSILHVEPFPIKKQKPDSKSSG